jgi:hypothetical protein
MVSAALDRLTSASPPTVERERMSVSRTVRWNCRSFCTTCCGLAIGIVGR